jgi:hypothetical protein
VPTNVHVSHELLQNLAKKTMQSLSPSSSSILVGRQVELNIKGMLRMSFDIDGIIHREFFRKGQKKGEITES